MSTNLISFDLLSKYRALVSGPTVAFPGALSFLGKRNEGFPVATYLSDKGWGIDTLCRGESDIWVLKHDRYEWVWATNAFGWRPVPKYLYLDEHYMISPQEILERTKATLPILRKPCDQPPFCYREMLTG